MSLTATFRSATVLTDAERTAVVAFLRRRDLRRLGSGDRVRATPLNGSPVVVNLVGLFTGTPCVGGTLAADELSRPLVQFVFDLAHAGNLIFALGDHAQPFATTLTTVQRTATFCPGVRLTASEAHLWTLVAPPDETQPVEAKPDTSAD